MKFFKPLNQRGFGHVELVLAVAFVALFAFVGVRVLNQSHAATVPYLTNVQCTLMGRVWIGGAVTSPVTNPCSNTCASGQGSLVSTATYNYCSAAVTKASVISASACASYGHVALASSSVYVGCAHRADQKTTANAPQCSHSGYTYYVQSTYDKCATTTSTAWTAIPTIYARISVTPSYSACISAKTSSTVTLNIRAIRTSTAVVSQAAAWSASSNYSSAGGQAYGNTWSNNVSIVSFTMPIADYLGLSYQTASAGYGYNNTLRGSAIYATCN